MKVKHLISLTDDVISVESEGCVTHYSHRDDVPEAIKNHDVVSLTAVTAQQLMIKIEKAKTLTLEEAGYSFDIGMGTE